MGFVGFNIGVPSAGLEKMPQWGAKDIRCPKKGEVWGGRSMNKDKWKMPNTTFQWKLDWTSFAHRLRE